MKNAYNQGLECDHGDDEGGDDGVSPKDVGHNIYILAHQVSHLLSLYCLVHLISHGLLSYFQVLVPPFIQHLPPFLWVKEEKKLPESLIVPPRAVLGAGPQANHTWYQNPGPAGRRQSHVRV